MPEPATLPGGGFVTDIPGELRALEQWVGWRTITKDGKRTKLPISPKTHKGADCNNRSEWGTFGEAYSLIESAGCDGVSFALSPDDPYCGIDLDDAIDEATGEIDTDALEIIERFATYTELSPSKLGLHIILKGKPPGGKGRKRGDRECYDRARFLTVTGLKWSQTTEIADRQELLEKWHAETFPSQPRLMLAPHATLTLTDSEIVKKVEQSKQGPKFNKLWHGNTDGYTSGSEADLALCSILSFWCGKEPSAVDRLFRASGLMRSKWDARRGDSTYGANTVAVACGSGESYNARYQSANPPTILFPASTNGKHHPEPAHTVATARGFKWASELNAPPKGDDWIWEGYLPAGAITLMSAFWKAGKTTLLSHFLKACGGGGKFLGQKLKAAKVLYVSEEGERHWVRRRDALEIRDHVGFYLQPFAAKPSIVSWTAFIEQLKRDVDEHKFDLVVFDTLAKLWPVQEENDAGAVDAALMPLWAITKGGAGILLIHHMRKSGGQEYTGSRGSGAISAFPDVIMELTRFDAANAKCRKRLIRAKGRYEDTPDEIVIELTESGYQLVDTPGINLGTDPAAEALPEEESRIMFLLNNHPEPWVTIETLRSLMRLRNWGIRNKDLNTHLRSLYNRSQVVVRGTVRSKTSPREYAAASRSDSFHPLVSDGNEIWESEDTDDAEG